MTTEVHTEEIRIEVDVRQRNALSVTLFNITLDVVIKAMEAGTTIT